MRPNLLAQFSGEAPPFMIWSAKITVDGTRVLLSTSDLKAVLEMRELHTEGKLLVYTGATNDA